MSQQDNPFDRFYEWAASLPGVLRLIVYPISSIVILVLAVIFGIAIGGIWLFVPRARFQRMFP